MSTRLSLVQAAVWSLSILSIGCETRAIEVDPNRPLTILFAGFTYVGSFPKDAHEAVPRHGTLALPLPTSVKPEAIYVFHYPASTKGLSNPMDLLPTRLKQLGFVTPGPENIIDVSSGGPLYGIRFHGTTCIGHISHEIDKALVNSRWPWDQKWEPDDTVLSVDSGCTL